MAHSCFSCLCSLQLASTSPSDLKSSKKDRDDCGAGKEKQGVSVRDSSMFSPLLRSFSSLYFCSHKHIGMSLFSLLLCLVFFLIYGCVMVPTLSNQLPKITSLKHFRVIPEMPYFSSMAQTICKY